MWRVLAGLLVLALAGPALAADLDNNGIENDEFWVPGTFDGETDRDEMVYFPTSQDTWQVSSYPYWWHVGDTVFGVHDVGLDCVDHAVATIKISYNVLNSGGHVDLDFRIDGVTVGSMVLLEEHGTGYVDAVFDFAAMVPPFELRWYETNQVAGGAGSVSIDETGLCSVVFSCGGTSSDDTTWGTIKDLYR